MTMPSQEIYTEATSRLHRILGVYLAFRGWITRSEAVVVSRDSLQTALDLKNLQLWRIHRFWDDNRGFFPHHEILQVDPGAKVVAVVLSRSPLPSAWVRQFDAGSITSTLSDAGLPTVEVELPAEDEIVRLLAMLAHGFQVS